MIPFVNLANPLPTTPGTGLTAGQEAALVTATRRQPVASIAALKALTAAAGDVVQVLGYATAGDGGAGVFRYDGSSSATAVAGMVVSPDSGPGRWFRVYSGPVNVRWFGAKGDGTTDDTAALQAALNASQSTLFPAGTYLVTSTLTLDGFASRRLDGYGAVIKFTPPSWPLSAHTPAMKITTDIISISVNGLGITSGAGWHADDPYGMVALQLRARAVVVSNCDIYDFYGSGIQVLAGTTVISGNRLTDVGGYNLTSDAGVRDNYGDGIVLFPSSTTTTEIVSGVISGNTLLISDPVAKRSRGGIVLDNPNKASGRKNNNVSIIGNRVENYDRGIHVEFSDWAKVLGNYVSGAQATVLVAASENVRVRDNVLIADNTNAADAGNNPTFKYGLVIYDRGCHGAVVDGNVIIGTTTYAAYVRWSNNIVFSNNRCTGDVSFGGGGVGSGYRIVGNTFNRRADVSDTGRLQLEASAGLIRGMVVEGNKFTNVRLDTTWMDGIVVKNNQFDFLTRDEWALGATSSYNAVITDNEFSLSDSAANPPLNFGACRGQFGQLSGNIFRTNASPAICSTSATGHQQLFRVERPNMFLRSNGSEQQITFSSAHSNGDSGNAGKHVYAASGVIPAGYYPVGSIVWNTSVAAGGTAAQICTTAGWYAPAWVGGTTYRAPNLVTNDSGKVYVCLATGAAAASGGPTGTGATITDGATSWSYVAANAGAVFKTLATAAP